VYRGNYHKTRLTLENSLAYTEMRLLLARMLWKFDLEAVPTERDWYDQKIFFLWEKGGLPIKLKEVVREKV
jgi:cytochrome P450